MLTCSMMGSLSLLLLTAGSVCLCGVCSPVIVLSLSVKLSWYPMLRVRLLR